VPVYIFNSDLVNAAPGDEEDPPPNNGNPYPVQGPILPGEALHVQQMADQFVNNLPQHQVQDVLNIQEQASNAGSVVQPVESEEISSPSQFTRGTIEEAVVLIDPLTLQIVEQNRKNDEFSILPKLQQLLSSCQIKISPASDVFGPAKTQISFSWPGMMGLVLQVPDAESANNRSQLMLTPHEAPQQSLVTQNRVHVTSALPQQLPVFTLRNQPITKVYKRRAGKIQRRVQQHVKTAPIFDSPMQDYERAQDELNTPIASLKRKCTPVSTADLRRSVRKISADNGFKPSSTMGTRNKAAKKKAMAKSHSPGKHSKPLFSMADFRSRGN
jgi:hypothetical protein